MTKRDVEQQIREAQQEWTARTLRPALEKLPSSSRTRTTLSEIQVEPLHAPSDDEEQTYQKRIRRT